MITQKIKDFANSYYFVYCMAIVTVAVWALGWEIAGLAFFVVIAGASLLFQRNVQPFVIVGCLIYFVVSFKQLGDIGNPEILAQAVPILVCGAVVVAFLFFCIIFHLVKFPSQGDKRFNLNGSFVAILIAIFLGGLFSGAFAVTSNLYVLATYLWLFVVYLIAKSGDVKDYKQFVSHLLIAIGVIMFAESIIYYLRCDNPLVIFENKLIDLGWGVTSNAIGPLLCFAVVAAMYMYVYKNRLVYFVLSILFGVGVCFTLSRGNIVGLAVALPFLVAFAVLRSKNKVKTIVAFSVIAVILAIVIIWQKDVLSEIFESMLDKGAYNTDRTALWGQFTLVFKEYPVFGNGFYSPEGVLYMPHSALLNIAAGAGLVGLVVFAYHYYKKYLVLFTYTSTYHNFACIACLMYIWYALIDISFFFPPHLVLVLVVLEAAKSERAELGIGDTRLKVFDEIAVPIVLIAAGVTLWISGTAYLFGAPYAGEDGQYYLSEVSYAIVLAVYTLGTVFVCRAAEALSGRFKHKLAKKEE